MTRHRRCRVGGAVGFALLAACAATSLTLATEVAAPAPVSPLRIAQASLQPLAQPQQQPPSQPAQPPQPVNEDEQQALGLLVDLQRYCLESGDDLKRELATANAALTHARSDANRIRLAMLLTLPAAGPTDDPRALSLLEPLVSKSATPSPLKQVAAVLYAQIAERSRSLREEQKKTAAAQEKLDALRAVERSLLLERSRNAGGGGAGGGGGTGR